MIAQLSPSVPLGSPSSSSIGVRCAGYFCEVLGARRLPPDVHLLEVEPGGAHEDAHGQVVDARLEDVQRVRGHVILLR